jgi:hypothetical protein
MFGLGHPEKIVDFAYRAMHEMTATSKKLIDKYYGSGPQFSYYKGCSTGGRQGAMNAQRYPEDFDGIIAGALANRHIQMHTSGTYRSIELARHPEGARPPGQRVVERPAKAADHLAEHALRGHRARKDVRVGKEIPLGPCGRHPLALEEGGVVQHGVERGAAAAPVLGQERHRLGGGEPLRNRQAAKGIGGTAETLEDAQRRHWRLDQVVAPRHTAIPPAEPRPDPEHEGRARQAESPEGAAMVSKRSPSATATTTGPGAAGPG